MHRIVRYLQRQEFTAGEYLIRQGAESDDLFFIESGQVTSQIDNPASAPAAGNDVRRAHGGRDGLLPQHAPVGQRHRR